MTNNKHITLLDQIHISNCLDKKMSFKKIGIEINKDCTTVSKEIRTHIILKKAGAFGHPYNSCIHRKHCDIRNLCSPCTSTRKYNFCKFCKNCYSSCTDFKQEFCEKYQRAPYVCNGCEKRQSCTLEIL